MKTKQLNHRQVRKAELLSKYKIKTSYQLVTEGKKPESFYRRSQNLPDGIEDERDKHLRLIFLHSYNLEEGMTKQCL